MEEKNLTPQESMAVITSMIEATKKRVAMPDLRISVMWALLTIIVAVTVFVLLLATGNSRVNFIWLAIPIIGIPLNIKLSKNTEKIAGSKNYVDKISDGIWNAVGYIALLTSAVCGVFHLCGYPQAWLAMFFYAFIIVGFGALAQGIVVKEGSYVFGGMFSIISGMGVIIVNLCNIPLLIVWVLPLYILCFLLMFIVPAVIIRRKLNLQSK